MERSVSFLRKSSWNVGSSVGNDYLKEEISNNYDYFHITVTALIVLPCK